MAVRKYSRQRESIREFLSSRTDHPSAETIYNHVREECPRISLGTVYRNLSFLADEGEISRMGCIGGCERFDARTDPHPHFICQRCGKVEDFDSLPVQSMVEAAEAQLEGKVTDFKVNFFGFCRDCVQEMQSPETENGR